MLDQNRVRLVDGLFHLPAFAERRHERDVRGRGFGVLLEETAQHRDRTLMIDRASGELLRERNRDVLGVRSEIVRRLELLLRRREIAALREQDAEVVASLPELSSNT